MNKVTLLCIPFSGGSKYSFSSLFSNTSAIYNPVMLELPGRGSRVSETLLDNITDVENDIFKQAYPHLNKPYAIYGHSLGGLLAYLLAKKIGRYGLKKPLHLFVTGASAPAVRFRKDYHLLGKEDFIAKVKSLRGMPDEILGNREIMDFFEPIIRADFKVLGSYEYEKSIPFNIPVTAIFGDEEEVQEAQMESWKMESTSSVDILKLEGGHFFIYNHTAFIQQLIEEKIEGTLQLSAPVS